MDPGVNSSTDVKHQLYLPFPYSQRITDPIPCDGGILLFELSSGGLFSTWSSSFGQYIQLKDATTLFRLFLTLIDRCCEIRSSFVLETTVDKVDFFEINKGELNPHNLTRAFRLWIPLSVIGAGAFSACMSSAYNEFKDEEAEEDNSDRGFGSKRPVKRARISGENKDVMTKFSCKDELLSAIRLYFYGKNDVTDICFDQDEDETDKDIQQASKIPHILDIFSAEEYFKRETTSSKHAFQRLHDSQRDLDGYITFKKVSFGNETNGITKQIKHFFPPKIVRNSKLTRLFTTGPGGFLKNSKQLLQYLLPTYVPPRQLVLKKLQCVASACGTHFDIGKFEKMTVDQILNVGESQFMNESSRRLFQDPILYSPVECNSLHILDKVSDYQGALDEQLKEIYPICSRLKCTYSNRVMGAINTLKDQEEIEKTFKHITHEISTLLTTSVNGVPDVYFRLQRESEMMLQAMQEATAVDETMFLAKKLFYKMPSNSAYTKYTKFGHKMLSILVGAKTCLRLMERQTALFLILFSRHMAVTANRTGVSGFFICAGPPDTGKSRACEMWLSCCAKALQLQSDGASGKAYTADDKTRDLRCSFEDELKDLLSADGTDASSSQSIKAKQSLLSNGVLTYERLVQNPNNPAEYILQKTRKAQRSMLVTCTNSLKNVPDAIQSRACCIPLAKESSVANKRRISANTLIAIRDNEGACKLQNAFMINMQLISALQGRFWSFECFGLVGAVDDSLFILFQCIFEARHGRDLMPPRRLLDMKRTAEALMVLDLVQMWYCSGIGAQKGMSMYNEALFYRNRAVIRMEHIIASFALMNQSTSFEVHIHEVEMVVKSLIKVASDGKSLERSEDGDYFMLSCLKRTLYNEISQQLPHLGAGLSNQLIKTIERGSTYGLPNIKFVSDGTSDSVFVNCRYIARVITPVERSILNILARYYKEDAVHFMTFDEKNIGFRAKIRESICHSEYEDTTRHPELENVALTVIKQALVFMSYRTTDTGEPMWETPMTIKACKEVPASTPNAQPYRTRPGKYKVAKSEACPLVVHPSLVLGKDGSPVGLYDKTFLTCLEIAGGYKPGSRVWAGMAPGGSGNSVDRYISMPERDDSDETSSIQDANDESEIKLRNPLYCPPNGMDILFDDDTDILPDDEMWPRSQEYIKFNRYSNVEERILKQRYTRAIGGDIPDEWLPINTNYN